jgi:hypothetical protein
MSFVFVADYFADEILGGGELNNEELISLLSAESSVIRSKSAAVTLDFLREHEEKCFIISNFIGLREECKSHLSGMKYVIYEHDHKYIRSRNPAMYEDYLAPKSEIVNYEFYKNAQAVFCQSAFHTEIVKKNLDLENIVNLGGNLWSEESLNKMLEYSQKTKANKCSIMESNIEHKNTRDAVQYCEYKRIPYELVRSSSYYDFLDKLSNNLKLIFLPKTPETLSRIVVEARMMNMGVTTNSRVGASSEPWFEKKGEELIGIMRLKRQEILEKVLAAFENE